ncbi:hypothetical protein E1B28_013490 [Marasmius oreades]|uniref:Uncharacterized protein n=1 Tax=Marasmius oreades TaxID=181124 RepID=A0A9P7RQR4_9AGAR|nr:uncharacterized protein E1B28_013490 [Marasmius oreades]KAG7087531.1 hypothetical protein E1B28_013490 [Marasmius oreades]
MKLGIGNVGLGAHSHTPVISKRPEITNISILPSLIHYTSSQQLFNVDSQSRSMGVIPVDIKEHQLILYYETLFAQHPRHSFILESHCMPTYPIDTCARLSGQNSW